MNCLTTREMAAVFFCLIVKQFINMKKEKKVLTKCVEAKKVKEFFNEISDLITSGHDKVWTSKDERRCVKMHTFCFLRTKPRLSQAGALLLPKDFVSLGIRISL